MKAKGEAGFRKAPKTEWAQNGLNVELREELERLKRRVGMGFEVNVRWLPDSIKYKDGKQLLEEVVGDEIVIYAEDPSRAKELLSHGFAEWLLNQHSKPYRQLINSLIALFEEQQYERKEKIIEALAKLMKEKET